MKEAMKINIIEDECVETRYLNRELNLFLCEKGYKPILLMNDETAASLNEKMQKHITFVSGDLTQQNKGLVGSYSSYKIFIDNDLDFGEVEIR